MAAFGLPSGQYGMGRLMSDGLLTILLGIAISTRVLFAGVFAIGLLLGIKLLFVGVTKKLC